MGFRVNPDRWMPMKDYLRLCWHFMTTDAPQSPYDDMFPRGKWSRRWSRVKTLDGPIHTLWVWDARVRYNWFTVGFHCWRKGHEWREEFITKSPQKKVVPKGEGVLGWENTGKWENHYIVSCAYCGKFRGHGRREV